MIVTLKPINIGALADWDTGNVTDMSSMFDGCSSLTDLNALINWDTSAVNNMKAMFNGISQLTDTCKFRMNGTPVTLQRCEGFASSVRQAFTPAY